MPKKHFTPEQIVTKLRQIEVLLSQGKQIMLVCREAGFSSPLRTVAAELRILVNIVLRWDVFLLFFVCLMPAKACSAASSYSPSIIADLAFSKHLFFAFIVYMRSCLVFECLLCAKSGHSQILFLEKITVKYFIGFGDLHFCAE